VESPGVQKIKNLCAFIRENFPDIQYMWIDTCCIDKRSAYELMVSIPSMFEWYRSAVVCLAYLSDVDTMPDESMWEDDFRGSAWHTRGWTLQELLAPKMVIFLNNKFRVMGYKGTEADALAQRIACGTGPCLNAPLSRITGIDQRYFGDETALANVDLATVRCWMNGRSTTEEEDMIYCVLGILNVHLNPEYSEGFLKAQDRLLEELRRRSRGHYARLGPTATSLLPASSPSRHGAAPAQSWEMTNTTGAMHRARIKDVEASGKQGVPWSRRCCSRLGKGTRVCVWILFSLLIVGPIAASVVVVKQINDRRAAANSSV
jgi:hypothetical protein